MHPRLEVPISPDSRCYRQVAFVNPARKWRRSEVPELPMHVVQSVARYGSGGCSRSPSTPARFRYSVTTFEPGARLVLPKVLINPRFRHQTRANHYVGVGGIGAARDSRNHRAVSA